jgi:hypothetical protein
MLADKAGQHIRTSAEASANWKNNQCFQAQASPENVYGLIMHNEELTKALSDLLDTFDKLYGGRTEARGALYIAAAKALGK